MIQRRQWLAGFRHKLCRLLIHADCGMRFVGFPAVSIQHTFHAAYENVVLLWRDHSALPAVGCISFFFGVRSCFGETPFHNAQLDHPVGKQLKRPLRTPCGRFATGCSDQLSSRFTIENTFARWSFLRLSFQSRSTRRRRTSVTVLKSQPNAAATFLSVHHGPSSSTFNRMFAY